MSASSEQPFSSDASIAGSRSGDNACLSASDLTNVLNAIPTALICVDFSLTRKLFAKLAAAGVTNIRAYLQTQPAQLASMTARLNIVTYNSSALLLYKANNLQELQFNMHHVLREDPGSEHINAAIGLWEGEGSVTRIATHYDLTGRRFHVRVKLTVMPGYEHDWSHVLFVIDDVTEEEEARRRLAESESYAKALFQLAPVSLWALNYSRVKLLMDRTRAAGVTDLRRHMKENPDFMVRYGRAVQLVDINEQSVALFAARDKASLIKVVVNDVTRIFPDGLDAFTDEALKLWEGKLRFNSAHTNTRLDGSRLDTLTQYAVLPGHEHDWSLVLVAEIDMTARNIAEERLEFLNRHDVLTGLYNRTAYTMERDRLVQEQALPIGVIVADLNGLKPVNDRFGHEAGDELLRRAGRVLTAATQEAGMIARIGGDEFVILLPHSDEAAAAALVAEIRRLTAEDNERGDPGVLSFAIGTSLCCSAGAIDLTIQQADMRMYRAKRAHYAKAG